MRQKADLMKLGVQNGVTDLNQIKRIYNIYADGGYLEWKKQIRRYKGLNIDGDNTYDYKGFFEEDPERAWDMLNEDSNAHFIDKFKTVYHPTFSTESKYSGVRHPKYNPNGIKGGTWSDDGHTFTMSDDLYSAPTSMDERINYLMDNEDYGVTLRESDGTLPLLRDGSVLGPILPAVEVVGTRRHKFVDGGPMSPEDLVLQRAQAANAPYNNYEDAVDLDDGIILRAKKFFDRGLSNCTLTASQLVNPSRPIARARTIVNDPRGNGYYQVSDDYSIPGTLVIASEPGKGDSEDSGNKYHTMIVSSYADRDYQYQFKGKTYQVKKGDPIVNYSRGKKEPENYVKGIPLAAYTDNSDGKTINRFYRPLDENGNEAVLLDEVVVNGYRRRK